MNWHKKYLYFTSYTWFDNMKVTFCNCEERKYLFFFPCCCSFSSYSSYSCYYYYCYQYGNRTPDYYDTNRDRYISLWRVITQRIGILALSISLVCVTGGDNRTADIINFFFFTELPTSPLTLFHYCRRILKPRQAFPLSYAVVPNKLPPRLPPS